MSDDKLSRREFLKTALGALAGAAIAPTIDHLATPPVPEGKPPSVVYIMADQLRACSIGCYGNSDIDTPRIDQLAAEGTRFTNAVTTSPVCTPHRACLMTGKYPNVTGVEENDVKLPSELTCIAELFSQYGYMTGYVGKWHLNGPTELPPADPGWVPPEERQGFQGWSGFNTGHVYYGSRYYWDQDPTMRQNPEDVYEPDFQTDTAIRFIKSAVARPFLIFLSIGIPHPRNIGNDLPPGGDYTFPYDPASLTLRPNVDYPDLNYAHKETADYYGMISNFDWNVGRVLDALEQYTLSDNTIVVVTADHGDHLGSHYGDTGAFRGKGWIFAEDLDIPFVMRVPQVAAPSLVEDMFTSVDILPTLLGLCRIPVPQDVMGRDFSPLLTKGLPVVEPPYGTPPSSNALVSTKSWVGLRTPEYTFEEQLSSPTPTRLFHNTLDPYQMTNRIDDPDYQQIKEQLDAELQAWLDYVGYT